MRRSAGCALLLSLATLWGCSSTVLVPVPPRMELKDYGTLGVVEFSSHYVAAVNARATREFQARIHAAQPGTRLLELGTREAVLAAVGSRQLDADALRKIGAKYGVEAVFLGEIAYSEPKTNIKVTDLSKLEGSARTEVRGDISSRLVETRTGAAVWSSSAWATRQVGRVEVSAEQGVRSTMRDSDPREDMVPTLVFHLTQDFRPTTVRQKAK
jgi:hypothetical protein